jgi:iron-sulfur cluster repair protein YtfE (RIC family)
MIEKEQILEKLLTAVPSYTSRYEQYINENYEPGEERLIYVDISDFVKHVIECYQRKKTEEFDALFEVIEQLHTNGDSSVKEVATVGILESFQNQLLDENIEYSEFERLLKSESKRWWNHLIDYWNGKTEYIGGPIKEQS